MTGPRVPRPLPNHARKAPSPAVSTPVALGGALGLIGIALVLVLSRSPLTVVAKNMVTSQMPVTTIEGRSEVCQEEATLPPGTSAIRLFIGSVIGPRLAVRVKSGSRTLTRGAIAAGWTGGAVTIPVARVARAARHVQVCVAPGPGAETVYLRGAAAPVSAGMIVAGRPLAARMRIDYMRPAARSWWSLLGSVSRRIGYERASGGSWVALLMIALMAGALGLCCRALLRELR